MKTYIRWLALLLVAAPASAQQFEAAGLFGYTTAGSLEPVASELEGYEIGGGFTWQAQFDYFFTPHLGVGASWVQREGDLTLSASSGTGELFEIDVRQLLGSVVYQWGTEDAKIRPFVLGGLGATFFEADDIPSETKLALAVGAGAKLFFIAGSGSSSRRSSIPRSSATSRPIFATPSGSAPARSARSSS